MSRHFPLLVLLTVVSPFVTLHTVLLPRWNVPALAPQPTPFTEIVEEEVDIPDFAGIESVHERKSQFFDFITQYVDQRNQELLALRKRIYGHMLTDEELQSV